MIILIPKANGEYRPVSLTSCFCKMMERIILNRLLYIIGDQLSSNLFGFLKGKSTSDCIIKCLANENDYYRIFIDLQGAFDKANKEVILYELAGLGVEGRLLRWIGDYLYERKAQVWYQGCMSGVRSFELGTPQGGVLSPTLFNVLMNKIASERYSNGVTPIIYADDILFQGKDISKVQTVLDNFGNLCHHMGLVVNEDKTKV